MATSINNYFVNENNKRMNYADSSVSSRRRFVFHTMDELRLEISG